MKDLKNSNLRTIRNLGLLTALFGGLSFYSFNCAPPSFQVADGGVSLSSLAPDITGNGDGGTLDTSVVAPQALLTTEQIYESMMNLTGQKAAPTNAQLAEFDRREGALGISPELEKMNAPMQIAITSFSGEVCNGLVAREQAAVANARQYTQLVNFGAAIGQLSNDSYLDVVSKMTNAFNGRAPSSEEVTIFTQFRTEFIATIPAANINQAAQTRALILATCSALLSTFDNYTY